MDKFEQTLSNIRNLRIQGAHAVAIHSLKAFAWKVLRIEEKDKESFFQRVNEIKEKVFSTRPTEPLMRNTIRYAISFALRSKDEGIPSIKQAIDNGVANALKKLEDAKQKIASIGAERIKDDSIVFTHCHSSTVIDILRHAKEEGKRFTVYNTETRPLYQGRKTAKELASLGIPVVHFVDSAARIALKNSDMALFGMDAVTTTRIYNKIGSEMFALIAYHLDVPLYVAGDSWKFDPESLLGKEEVVEERSPKEIWDDPPKGVEVRNLSFEGIKPELVTAIISELGSHPHQAFIEEVIRAYPHLSPSYQLS